MTAREFQTLKIVNDSSMVKECNCLPTCTAITYNSEISQAAMNWKQYIDGVGRGTNKHFDKYFIPVVGTVFYIYIFLVFNYRR